MRKFEREADVFAAELLMPEKAVQRKFKSIFDRDRIRSQSFLIEKLRDKDQVYARRRSRVDQSNPLNVARSLVTYKSAPDQRSLVEFFGASVEAMSYRLIELNLVF
jgi:Zn-dependent peptidase ImmA (M78 family)